jgi:hypothetical protein
MRNPFKRNKAQKAIAGVHETLMQTNMSEAGAVSQRDGRGYQVYTMSQLMGITGAAKDGSRVTGYYEQPIFYLTLEERVSIFRLCSPVFSVVTSRMNRISGMDWTVVCDKYQEDKLYERLRALKQVCDEYQSSKEVPFQVARQKLLQEIRTTLPDVLPDLSNFQNALIRWKRRIAHQKTQSGEWVKDWMMQPNINDKFPDLTKKMIMDLMVHGSVAMYKETMNNKVENVYALPGGTVLPLKNVFAGGVQGFVQIMLGYEPQIMYGNEMAYATYIPTTARSHGFIPLEALINKISESLLFDKLMADQADGTKLPEKMVIIANASPFGTMDKEFNIPIDQDEQKRVEQKLNTPKKGAIMTFTGNTATVVDLSRENTMSIQMQRQKDIREEVGLIFQATPMEMSLSGSDDTSGRSTSEAQERIYHSSGVLPIVKILETLWNYDILPYRFGPGYKLEFSVEKSEKEEMETLKAKMDTGVFSINEVRSDDLNLDPFPDEKFDVPQAGGGAGDAGGEGANPMGGGMM